MTIPSGLSAFPITPSDPSGQVDTAALRRLLAPLVAAKVASIGLLGSTGTYAYLSRSERRRALDAALDEVAGRVPIVVGIGALRTDEAVALAQDARAAGSAAGLLAPVSYTPLTDDEVFEHFRTVARESGLPICIYDNPSTTHFHFKPALIGRLSKVDGIVAVKSPAGDPVATASRLSELRGLVTEGFSLGSSVDWNSAEAMIAGAEVWYSVVGGLFPEIPVAIAAAARSGDHAEARRLDATLAPLWEIVRKYSSLRMMYAAAALKGLTQAEPPRPILPLSPAARDEVAAVLGRLGLI